MDLEEEYGIEEELNENFGNQLQVIPKVSLNDMNQYEEPFGNNTESDLEQAVDIDFINTTEKKR